MSAKSSSPDIDAGHLSIVLDRDVPRLETTAYLMGLSGNAAGKLYPLRDPESIIGRADDARIRISEKAVSQHHARLVQEEKSHVVEDLGSTNGTFVNDSRVIERTPLQSGDVIRVGETLLGYITDSDDEHGTRVLARTDFKPSFRAGGQELDALGSQAPSGLDSFIDKAQRALLFLRRYWQPCALLCVLGALIGAASLVARPPRSVAAFEIYLRHDPSHSPVRNFVSQDVDFFRSAERTFVNPEVAKKTLEAMGQRNPSTGSVRAVASDLSFEAIAHNTYRGTFRHTDPEYAGAFLSEHVKQYLDREMGKSLKVLGSEVDLLRAQLRTTEKNLKHAETELKSFKEKHIDGLPQAAADQLRSRIELAQRRDELSASLIRLQKELALKKQQLDSEDAIIERRVEQSRPYESELASVRRKLAAARSQGLDLEHPEIKLLKKQEAELVALSNRTIYANATELDRRANPEHKRLKNAVGELDVAAHATEQELGLVTSRLAELDQIAKKLPDVEARHSELGRTIEESKTLHAQLFEQLKAKELQLDFERASVKARYEIIEPTSVHSPSPAMSAATRSTLGAVAGGALGIALALLHWLIAYARRRPRHRAALG